MVLAFGHRLPALLFVAWEAGDDEKADLRVNGAITMTCIAVVFWIAAAAQQAIRRSSASTGFDPYSGSERIKVVTTLVIASAASIIAAALWAVA